MSYSNKNMPRPKDDKPKDKNRTEIRRRVPAAPRLFARTQTQKKKKKKGTPRPAHTHRHRTAAVTCGVATAFEQLSGNRIPTSFSRPGSDRTLASFLGRGKSYT